MRHLFQDRGALVVQKTMIVVGIAFMLNVHDDTIFTIFGIQIEFDLDLDLADWRLKGFWVSTSSISRGICRKSRANALKISGSRKAFLKITSYCKRLLGCFAPCHQEENHRHSPGSKVHTRLHSSVSSRGTKRRGSLLCSDMPHHQGEQLMSSIHKKRTKTTKKVNKTSAKTTKSLLEQHVEMINPNAAGINVASEEMWPLTG